MGHTHTLRSSNAINILLCERPGQFYALLHVTPIGTSYLYAKMGAMSSSVCVCVCLRAGVGGVGLRQQHGSPGSTCVCAGVGAHVREYVCVRGGMCVPPSLICVRGCVCVCGGRGVPRLSSCVVPPCPPSVLPLTPSPITLPQFGATIPIPHSLSLSVQ